MRKVLNIKYILVFLILSTGCSNSASLHKSMKRRFNDIDDESDSASTLNSSSLKRQKVSYNEKREISVPKEKINDENKSGNVKLSKEEPQEVRQKKKIEILKYNTEWPQFYQFAIKDIKNTLGKLYSEGHHIGSTAVPGLGAKPIIDILIVVTDINKITDPLKQIGYKYKGEYNIPLRPFFSKKDKFKINLHAHEKHSAEIDLNIKFRDHLLKNPDIRKEYEKAKKLAASHHDSTKNTGTGSTVYNLNKNATIVKILNQADFRGLCPRFCNQDNEWEFYKKLRTRALSIEEDIDKKDKTRKCMVLYAGTQTVLATEIDMSEQNKMKIRFIEKGEQGTDEHVNFMKEFLKKYGTKKGLEYKS